MQCNGFASLLQLVLSQIVSQVVGPVTGRRQVPDSFQAGLVLAQIHDPWSLRSPFLHWLSGCHCVEAHLALFAAGCCLVGGLGQAAAQRVKPGQL